MLVIHRSRRFLAATRRTPLVPGKVVHNEDQLMLVIAVKRFNIDARRGHPSRDFSELTRFRLVQPLDEHVPLGQTADTRSLERTASGGAILEKKMRYALTSDHPRSSAGDAHASPAQSIPHISQGAGAVLEDNG
jgi:hypothetical protein